MSKNREIEAKILLTKNAYNELKNDFKIKEEFTQKNYYFDTPTWTLKNHRISLRIRIFANHAEQTMKVPDKNPLQKDFHESIEINDPLSLNEANDLLKTADSGKNLFFTGNIGDYIKENLPQVKDKLHLFSWSKTKRILSNGPFDIELTLDQTSYPDGYQDFELEIENTNPNSISKVLELLENKYYIGKNNSNINFSKIARATIHKKL